MTQARSIYIGVMCVAGLILAAFTLAWPQTLGGYMTPFAVMLIVSFLVDLALMRMAKEGEITPLSVETRFAGFFGGMVLYLVVTTMLGSAT
ncbi:MAG: hypothetical protein JWN93_2103 [Hyphomicrobiales bacterium]|nr:hypothetical protein [Hyphomicrobiales bacterium]